MIDITKKYKTRDGNKVRIYSIDGGGIKPIHGAINRNGVWTIFSWLATGRDGSNAAQSIFDLVEVTPYSKLKINDPVVVWDNDSTDRHKEHFARIDPKTSRAATFKYGKTSHTSRQNNILTWDNCVHIKDYKGSDPF